MLLKPLCVSAQEALGVRTGETEDFRRSSLCLMLITHRGDKYAKAIEEQFQAMPLPSRYNDLNIRVRVISNSGKTSDKSVASMLRQREVAKELVGMWFNRDWNGRMNMDRIHKWGGYNASYSDLQRAQNTERGLYLLSDEGSELIKNTFVLVCDISYFDRAKTGQWLNALGQGLAAFSNSMAQQYERKGRDASAYRQLGESFQLGAKAAEDIAGFSVNVMARLYRLKWDDSMRDYFYTQYWIDAETPEAEAARKKAAFELDRSSYQLEYLGNYRSRAGRTVSKSGNNLDLVVRDVCANAVDRSIINLSKMFPVFRAKSQFSCDGNSVYAYIGTKEGLSRNSKFEVLETKKTSKGFEYHKVAELKPRTVWNNQGLNIGETDLSSTKGSSFYRSSGRNDICNQGLLIRESGKLGYQYKRHRWYFEPFVGMTHFTSDKLQDKAEDQVKDNGKSSKSSKSNDKLGTNYRQFKCAPIVFGLSTGWIINYHTNIAWNPINFGAGYGTTKDKADQAILSAYASTGLILRTSPLGKKGMFAFYVWPTIGARFAQAKTQYRYGGYKSDSYDSFKIKNMGILDWNVKAGVTLGERFSIGASYNDLYWSGLITIYL